MSEAITINNEEYEVIPPAAVAASKLLVDAYITLGRPKDPYNESGKKMMRVIITSWEDLYPKQAMEWYEARREYQNEELSINEQVKNQTGRSLASYPYPIYQMLKKFFPELSLHSREDNIKFVKEYPVFRFANKI